MIRNVLSALFALTIAIGLSGCGSGDSQEAVDTTEHDNWVYLSTYWGFAQLAFDLTGYSITSGQPWGGVSTGQPDQTWGIDAKAGRHGSSTPAEWFKSHASVAVCTGYTCSSAWPSELNFAMTGTLTINGTSYPITIGQGSTALGVNNWWIGGPGWTIHSGTDSNVVTPDGQYLFRPVLDDNETFWICTSYGDCPPD